MYTCFNYNRKLIRKLYSQNTEFYLCFPISIDEQNSNGENPMILSPAVAEIHAFQYVFRTRSTFYLALMHSGIAMSAKWRISGGVVCFLDSQEDLLDFNG